MHRLPACAGQFYEASAEKLREQVQALLAPSAPVRPAAAIVCPHAGLMFSGIVAGAVYSQIHVPSRAILVGPNHTGYGPPLSVYHEGEWELPGGVLSIASDLAAALLTRCPEAVPDELAHRQEHCLEVQLPFLHSLRPDIRILPVVVGTQDLGSLIRLGQALAAVVNNAGGDRPILIASTDMTHCGPGFGQWPPSGMTADAFARAQDQLALEALHSMDERKFHKTIEQHGVTMCGYAPTTSVITAARTLGAHTATLMRYGTSADITGDVNRVVGYAGLVID
jgi:AmmeMemoRadiSam system protein B